RDPDVDQPNVRPDDIEVIEIAAEQAVDSRSDAEPDIALRAEQPAVATLDAHRERVRVFARIGYRWETAAPPEIHARQRSALRIVTKQGVEALQIGATETEGRT